MGRKISLSIDTSKLNEKWFVIGKTGTKYLTFDVYENDVPDKYGNGWAAKQSPPKDVRLAMKAKGEKIPYCGNGKEWDRPAPSQAPKPNQPTEKQLANQSDDTLEDPPF